MPLPPIKFLDEIDMNQNDVINAPNINNSGEDKNYVFQQDMPLATWNIAHNLGKYPSVMVVDSANDTVLGDVEYIDTNNLKINFGAPFSGKAYLN